MMNKHRLLLILLSGLIVSFMAFSISVKAAEGEMIWYRCSNSAFSKNSPEVELNKWKELKDKPQCTTQLDTGDAYIYMQFRKGASGEITDIYTIKFTYKAVNSSPSPSPSPSLRPSSSPTPLPSSTPKATTAPAQENGYKRCSNGLILSAEDAKYDVYEDCKINSFDVSSTYRHFTR